MCDKAELDIITEHMVDEARAVLGEKLDSVRLFGSYSRGDYDDESDIDIMVLADIRPEDIKSYAGDLVRAASRLSLRHGVAVSVLLKDRQTFDTWVGVVPFYRNVVEEGILLSA